MINIDRWYCDTYIMGLETGVLFGTMLVVQSLRPPLHGQDHISPIWQGCKILDQHSQYSYIVYHTTGKIDIQNSFPNDISLGSSNFILDGGTSQSIWHFVSSGGSPLQRASGHCHRGSSKSRHRSCWESTCHRRGVDYGAFVVLSQMNLDL